MADLNAYVRERRENLPDLSPPGGQLPATKAVLQPTDFTYLGSWRVPAVPALDGGALNPSFTLGLSHRYVGGQLRLIVCGMITNARKAQIAEVRGDVVLKTTTPYNTPAWYGSGAVAYMDGGTTTFSGGVWTEAIRWDPVSEVLYWSQVRAYDSANDAPPTTGLIKLTTPSGDTGSTQLWALGPVRMAPTAHLYGTRYIKDLTFLPDWFTARLPGGTACRLGLGFGGNLSTQASGPCSMGPALVATTPLDPLVDVALAYRETAPRVRCVMHPFHTNGVGVPPLHAIRDTHYGTTAPDMWPPPNGSYGAPPGYWASEDFNQGHGCWVETDTKAGLLVFPRFTTGGGLTTVTSEITPTTTQWALPPTYAARLLPGDKFLVDNGYLRPGGNADFDARGLGEVGTISGISGNVITVSPALHQAPPVGNRFLTGEWYVDGVLGWGRGRPAWCCYDPAALVTGARGDAGLEATRVDLVPIAWEANPPGGGYPDFAASAPYVFPATEGGHRGTVRGATYDGVTRRLHVLVHGGNVHVYQVT